MENKSHLTPVTHLRLTAEKRLALTDQAVLEAEIEDKSGKSSSAKKPVIEELLQALRVHQIELEVQNEALRQAQLAAEESRDRYVSLYEFAPVGYLTLTETGRIVEANLACADLLGENRSALIKQQFARFIVPEDGDQWHQHFYGSIEHGKTKSCEVRLRRANGTIIFARIGCLLVEPDGLEEAAEKETEILDDSQNLESKKLESKKLESEKLESKSVETKALKSITSDTDDFYMRVALTDITELKLAEQELRVAATVFESQEGMMVTDAKNVILKVNHAFTNITGYNADEVIGKTPRMLSSGRHDSEFYSAMWSIIQSTGAWHGEIWNRRKNGEIYPQWLTITSVKANTGNVTHYVATLTDITARKLAEDEMQLLAFYDPLTRLPNRRLLLDRLKRAMANSARTRQNCALMFVDLDNFKSLNDTMGHDIGDMMLQIVAQRLAVCVREGDTVSRMGGDEFMVMLENLNENAEEASALAETIGKKILTAINQPFQLAGNEYISTASIGITVFINHFFTVAEIQKQADVAMYAAKTAGRNVLRFFKA